MSTWFEGTVEINCDFESVKQSLADPARHFAGVVRQMPAISEVELLEHGSGAVRIRTNEGVLQRRNIECTVLADSVLVRYDEIYEAGKKVTTSSHFEEEFTPTLTGVVFHTRVSDVQAPGLLGFLYRTFGAGSMGKAFLSSQKAFLESLRR